MNTEIHADDKFKFSCHPGLACFGQCCRDINIFLSPYDVVRLKNKLGITSTEFLDRYAIRHSVPKSGFSVIQLKMREDQAFKCPFVTAGGCAVYAERPWSCRMAPVEMRGNSKYGFCFNNTYCLGLNEEKEQTVREWMRDQEMEIYEEAEKTFKEIPLRLNPAGPGKPGEILSELFFMACYDLDRFEKLVLEPGFVKTFHLSRDVADKIKNDQIELMKYGFGWLLSGITGQQTMEKLGKMLKRL